MKPYSVDLRERVVSAVDQGLARTEVARLFQVSLGSIKRWLLARGTTGDLRPSRPTGRRLTITPAQEAELQACLEASPDATFAEHAAHWNTTYGTTLSQWTLGRASRRIRWSRKKRPS